MSELLPSDVLTEPGTADPLAKCPFCGWNGDHQKGSHEFPYFVRCENCLASTGGWRSEAQAAEMWNMRIPK